MFDGKCSCIYCKEIRLARGIHTHVDRSHFGSTKYSSGNNGKYKLITENIIRKYYQNPKQRHAMESRRVGNRMVGQRLVP